MSSIIDTFGIDDVMWSVTHKLVCDSIDEDIESAERRDYILKKIEKALDIWVE